MNRITILLAAILLPIGALAEDALMDGGRSPNAEMEIRIVNTGNPNDSENIPCRIELWAKDQKKPLLVFNGPGFGGYAAAVQDCHAFWNPSNRFVAISERADRHSRQLHVFAILRDGARQLDLPDYVQNALGRVDATQVDFACGTNPKAWHENDLILGLYFTANSRIFYTCEVTLGFTMEEDSRAFVELKKVTHPEGRGG